MARPVVFITGASSGIGAASVRVFAEAGWDVMAAARRVEPLQKNAQLVAKDCPDARIEVKACDVNSEQQVSETLAEVEQKFGRLDALVNNAGYGVYGTLEEISIDQFRENMETNYFGVIRCCKAALPLLRISAKNPIQALKPAVVMVSSFVGRRSFPGMTSYCASKFALEGLSEGLRLELWEDGITLSVVNPGVTRTEFFDVMDGERPAGYLESSSGMQPIEVARVILKSVYKPKRNIYLTTPGKAGMLANWLSPRLFDWILSRKWRGPAK